MPDRKPLALDDEIFTSVASYQLDAIASLRLYFSSDNPEYAMRFVGKSFSEIEANLQERLDETDIRSSFALLSRLEALFRADYRERCTQKRKDPLSKAFISLYKTKKNGKQRKEKVRLDDEIFTLWEEKHPETKKLIGELKGAFRFRHWVAHGRYWQPRLGSQYDFEGVYILAESVWSNFPLHGLNC